MENLKYLLHLAIPLDHLHLQQCNGIYNLANEPKI